METGIDLRQEQDATLARPRYAYSATTRLFTAGMDALAGAETTLPKVKVIESLAPIPYRAWENREYGRLTRHYEDGALLLRAETVLRYGREAQDNEIRHLRVVEERLRQLAIPRPRYLIRPLPGFMAQSYRLMSATLARVGIRQACLLNAEFEDHAEHTYAELVRDHPEWEEEPATGEAVREYAEARGVELGSWADVFRRIGLDERDHRNASFAFAGKPDEIVHYTGMPEVPSLAA